MHIKNSLPYAFIACAVTVGSAQTAGSNNPTLGGNILTVSESEQIAFIRSTLDRCIPPDDTLTMLVLNRSSLTLPLIEAKIEEVLSSSRPLVCLTGRQVDPPIFIDLAARTMAYSGDAVALRQIAKLMTFDEKRFGTYVDVTLINAEDRRNVFSVAYNLDPA